MTQEQRDAIYAQILRSLEKIDSDVESVGFAQRLSTYRIVFYVCGIMMPILLGLHPSFSGNRGTWWLAAAFGAIAGVCFTLLREEFGWALPMRTK